MFEKSYIFGHSQGDDVRILTSLVHQLFLKTVLSKDNFYICTDYYKSNRNKYIDIRIDSNTKIDGIKLIHLVESISIDSVKFDFSSTCVAGCYPEKDLQDKEFVEMLKETYGLQGEIEEIPYDEGDDWNFISPTLHHWDIKFKIMTIQIKLDRVSIQELLNRLK